MNDVVHNSYGTSRACIIKAETMDIACDQICKTFGFKTWGEAPYQHKRISKKGVLFTQINGGNTVLIHRIKVRTKNVRMIVLWNGVSLQEIDIPKKDLNKYVKLFCKENETL